MGGAGQRAARRRRTAGGSASRGVRHALSSERAYLMLGGAHG
jgi:hypothetical protein